MTALVSSNSTFLLTPTNNSSHTPGILLNSRCQSSPSHPREPRQPSSFASSSSSASQTSQSQSPSEGEGPSRKIRFAPLPAPRRDELPSVFYESDSDSQLPQSGSAPSSSYPQQQPPSPHGPSVFTLQQDDTPSKSKSRTWGQKILRPLLYPLLPSTTPNGGESYPALFRISSRDSTRGNTELSSDFVYKGGVPLVRRMSTGSRAISSTKEAERSRVYHDGVPLTPVMSEGFSSKGRKDGQRMLNGRVYGRRYSASQNGTQGSYEPEFVEWGYGGMGSVVNNQRSRSGPDWAKLQSKGKVPGGASNAEEEDDGSGMGWVKRRRAQREREQREREDREHANPETAVPKIAVHSPQVKEGDDPSRPPLRRNDSDQSRNSGEHHVYRAVSIPALHHSRHQPLHKTGDGSGSVTPTSLPALSRANSSSSVPMFRTASLGSYSETLPTMSERREDAEISSGSSETSSTSIDGDDDDDDCTERESDDDDDDAEGRITSRGAGVEKISRHKD